MAKYKIFVKASAGKEIEKIPTRKDRRRIIKKIRSLSDNPRPRGSVKLSGKDKYRLRQRNYRIIYSIEDDKLIVVIVKVGHRKNISRN